MEITLEKIELVKDRTGATYKDAKEALEAANGSVIDAILAIEEKTGEVNEQQDFRDNPIFKKAKAIVDKGNMSKLIITADGKEVVNFPLTVGVMGVIFVPWAVVFGVIATIGLNCGIQFVNDKGELVDLNGSVVGIYDKAKHATSGASEKGAEIFNNLKHKGTDIFNNVKEKAKDASEEFKIRQSAMKDQPFEDKDFEVDYEVVEEDK